MDVDAGVDPELVAGELDFLGEEALGGWWGGGGLLGGGEGEDRRNRDE